MYASNFHKICARPLRPKRTRLLGVGVAPDRPHALRHAKQMRAEQIDDKQITTK